MRGGLVLLFGLAACIEPTLVECPGDLICAPGSICDPIHHQCVSQDQLDACEGKADLSACEGGYCDRGVCMTILCGNGVVDPGEACDDGNQDGDDSCNMTCTSTEACGNGIADPEEACEDGNLVDGDGCSSRCEVETERWTVEGISLRYGEPGRLVHDAAHHQLIEIAEGLVWRWDGTAWTLISGTGPSGIWLWQRVVYDSDRGRVIVIGRIQTTAGVNESWEWDGTAWTKHTSPDAPSLNSGLAVYDPVRHVVLVVGARANPLELWTFDPSSGVWTLFPGPPGLTSLYSSGFAFDVARGVAVFTAVVGTRVFEWDGTAWTSITAQMPASTGSALLYDPTQSAVIAYGGSASKTVAKWTGSAWVTLPELALPTESADADVAYDADRQRLVAFGGRQSNNTINGILEWDGLSWREVTIGGPRWIDSNGNLSYGFDPVRAEMIQLGGSVFAGVDTWVLDAGGWRQIGALPGPNVRTVLAYDPVRDAFVVNTTDASTRLLKDELWLVLEEPGTSAVAGMVAMTYDPERGGVVGIDGTSTWLLPSTASTWSELGDAPIGTFGLRTLAFDAQRHQLIYATTQGTFESTGSTWVQTLGPVAAAILPDQRRGSVVVHGGSGARWERANGVWTSLPRSPVPISSGGGVYIGATGELVDIGTTGRSRVLLRRTLEAPAAREICDDEDRDGDQLFACDDPDCWWQCGTCPPHASCP